jgi:hypothetical protein
MPKLNPEKHKQWTQKLRQFKASGLSASQWCKLHSESYSEFSYYKEMYSASERVTFQELQPEQNDPPSTSPIEISYGPIAIKITPPYSAGTLELCLNALRTCYH